MKERSSIWREELELRSWALAYTKCLIYSREAFYHASPVDGLPTSLPTGGDRATQLFWCCCPPIKGLWLPGSSICWLPFRDLFAACFVCPSSSLYGLFSPPWLGVRKVSGSDLLFIHSKICSAWLIASAVVRNVWWWMQAALFLESLWESAQQSCSGLWPYSRGFDIVAR